MDGHRALGLTGGGRGGRYRWWGNSIEERGPLEDLWAVPFST